MIFHLNDRFVTVIDTEVVYWADTVLILAAIYDDNSELLTEAELVELQANYIAGKYERGI